MRLVDIAPMLEFLDLQHYDKDMFVSQYNAAWIYSWLESQPTIEQPTWISVDDRLPIENGKYLVIREYSAWERSLRDISIEYYSTEFEGWFFDATKLLGVTHWMPLPQPPKGV